MQEKREKEKVRESIKPGMGEKQENTLLFINEKQENTQIHDEISKKIILFFFLLSSLQQSISGQHRKRNRI